MCLTLRHWLQLLGLPWAQDLVHLREHLQDLGQLLQEHRPSGEQLLQEVLGQLLQELLCSEAGRRHLLELQLSWEEVQILLEELQLQVLLEELQLQLLQVLVQAWQVEEVSEPWHSRVEEVSEPWRSSSSSRVDLEVALEHPHLEEQQEEPKLLHSEEEPLHHHSVEVLLLHPLEAALLLRPLEVVQRRLLQLEASGRSTVDDRDRKSVV